MRTGVTPERIATGNVYSQFFFKERVTSVDSTRLSRRPRSSVKRFFQKPLTNQQQSNPYFFFLRKEVIQPHLPIRLPCYDFTPVTTPALDGSLLAVKSPALGIRDSHGVTGGVYKTRERIHRDILIRDY